MIFRHVCNVPCGPRPYRGVRYRRNGTPRPPGDSGDISPTWHLYLLQVDPEEAGGDVQEFRRRLTGKGGTNIPHFAPMYKFDVCKQLGYDEAEIAASRPVAEEAFYRRFTHLPLYPLSDEQLVTMADLVIQTVEDMRSH